jgi:hypothetical protein
VAMTADDWIKVIDHTAQYWPGFVLSVLAIIWVWRQ